jgi:transposase
MGVWYSSGMARPRAKLDRCGEADLVSRRLETEPPGPRRERLLALQLGLAGDWGLAQIARAVGRSRATIQTWFNRYRQGGVDALVYDAREDNPGRPSELSGLALAELQKDLENGRWRSVPQIQRWLAQTHGVKLALSSLYDRLGKVRARLRVPRKSHVKKDPAASVEFRTELAARLTALALPAGRPVRVWVLDEMRYGLHGFTRRVWGLPGHRPVVPTQQKYQWGFVYGAVAVGLRRAEFLLTETMDRPHSQQFYRQLGQSDPAACHVLIQDGAGFHLGDGDPGLPANVRILTLPAYSPELNPIEGLWDQVKDGLCNQVFATLAELEIVLQSELRRFWQDARRLGSLTFDWLQAQVNTSSSPIIPLN